MGGGRGEAAVLGALLPAMGVVDQRTVAVLETRRAVTALFAHGLFLALIADTIWLPRSGDGQPQPSSCRRSSSMP